MVVFEDIRHQIRHAEWFNDGLLKNFPIATDVVLVVDVCYQRSVKWMGCYSLSYTRPFLSSSWILGFFFSS